jgi:hypothetical protein
VKTRLARPAARLLAVLPLLCLTLARTTTAAAAPFTNLDFEQATVVVNDPMFGLLDWDLAFPGWEQLDPFVNYGTPHVGMTRLVMLAEAGGPEPWSPPAVSGQYSALIRNGAGEDAEDAWLAQTGDVPVAAKAIEFLVDGDEPEVYLGGVQLSLVEIDEPGFIRRFAANVVPFAGATAELKFLYPGNPNFDPDGINYKGGILDDIAFTQRIIPEPSTWVMALLGLVAAFAFSRRR